MPLRYRVWYLPEVSGFPLAMQGELLVYFFHSVQCFTIISHLFSEKLWTSDHQETLRIMNTHMGEVLTIIHAEKRHSFRNFCFIVVRRLYQNAVDSRLKGQKVRVTGGLASYRNILSDIIKSVGSCIDILVQILTFVNSLFV